MVKIFTANKTAFDMTNMLKSEFSWKRLSLNFGHGEESLHRSWIVPQWTLLLLRFILAAFCIVIIIVSGVQKSDPRWFIYLTNWSFLLLTMAMLGLALISIIHAKGESRCQATSEETSQEIRSHSGEATDAEQAPQSEANQLGFKPLVWYEKGVWFLWIVASNAALVVTLNYWILVFEPPTDFMDIAVHALNSIVMLVEFFIASTPVRVLHVLYVMVFSVVYSLFTVIYWAAGGVTVDGDPYIYEILDYENGDAALVSAVLLGIVFIVSPLMQAFLFGLYQLRCFLHRKIMNHE